MFLIGELGSTGSAQACEPAPDFRLPARLRDILQESFVRLNRVIPAARELLRASQTNQQILVIELARLLVVDRRRIRGGRLGKILLRFPRRGNTGASQRADGRAARLGDGDLVRRARRWIRARIEAEIAELVGALSRECRTRRPCERGLECLDRGASRGRIW